MEVQTVVEESTTYMNNSNNKSIEEISSDDILNSLPAFSVLITLYTFIFCMGVSGNVLVLYVVIRNKPMQTITNIFITNLAFSDILLCFLAVPITPLSYYMNSWIFGEVLCHIFPILLCICVYVSTLTSTVIALIRYRAIMYPFKSRMRIHVCLLIIVALWVISISTSLPLGIYQQVIYIEDSITSCQENWPNETAPYVFTGSSLVLQYIVPCSIITYCYSKVSLELQQQAQNRMRMIALSESYVTNEIRRQQRTNKMLIAMVTIFVCCWLPLNAVIILGEYHATFQQHIYFPLIFFIAHGIAMSSAIYNPLLYATMNDSFKKEFKLVLPCLIHCRTERNVQIYNIH